MNTGSAADVRETVARTGQLDVERVRSDATVRAYGYRTQGTSFEAEAGLQRAAAANDATAGFLKAGGLLLSGAGSVIGSKWDALKTTTTPGLSTAMAAL